MAVDRDLAAMPGIIEVTTMLNDKIISTKKSMIAANTLCMTTYFSVPISPLDDIGTVCEDFRLLPHFEQYSASSEFIVPHLLQYNFTTNLLYLLILLIMFAFFNLIVYNHYH